MLHPLKALHVTSVVNDPQPSMGASQMSGKLFAVGNGVGEVCKGVGFLVRPVVGDKVGPAVGFGSVGLEVGALEGDLVGFRVDPGAYVVIVGANEGVNEGVPVVGDELTGDDDGGSGTQPVALQSFLPAFQLHPEK